MKFIIQASGEMLESNAGLLLAGKILAGLDLDRRANGMAIDKMLEPRIKNADVVRSYFGLLVLGRTAFEDIELFRASGYFRRALGIKRVPSAETLRQRLDVKASVLVRMDSGNDAAENVRLCRDAGKRYLIKRNLRREKLEDWLGIARIYGVAHEPRAVGEIQDPDASRGRDDGVAGSHDGIQCLAADWAGIGDDEGSVGLNDGRAAAAAAECVARYNVSGVQIR